jgi:hypothetical protein
MLVRLVVVLGISWGIQIDYDYVLLVSYGNLYQQNRHQPVCWCRSAACGTYNGSKFQTNIA